MLNTRSLLESTPTKSSAKIRALHDFAVSSDIADAVWLPIFPPAKLHIHTTLRQILGILSHRLSLPARVIHPRLHIHFHRELAGTLEHLEFSSRRRGLVGLDTRRDFFEIVRLLKLPAYLFAALIGLPHVDSLPVEVYAIGENVHVVVVGV